MDLTYRTAPLTAAAAVAAVTLAGCGSGDSTVAKTPQATKPASGAPGSPAPSAAAPPNNSAAPVDPCVVNLASPTIARVFSDLPRDPRSQQPWNPEPVAGNYNQCAQLLAAIIKANTNGNNPTTWAVCSTSATSFRRVSRTPMGSTASMPRRVLATRSR